MVLPICGVRRKWRGSGLDRASPRNMCGARILERILDDEIRLVRFRSTHFVALAESRGESPEILWKTLVARHFGGTVKPPFNDSTRLSAGLPRSFHAGVAS
ncbi:DUF455 family protein [Novosphingobium sp.]|uniref:DUF455 family protein n=1 Tax=Novosphingobium sp. TaxID=1874826 RepID=UPI00286B73A8|nr:DUF455 family protein [Novosphingobium sp.]